jgi:hypothetical protein
MRALTVEELQAVCGGTETVVVTARRRPNEVDPATWQKLMADQGLFDAYCNNLAGAFGEAQDNEAFLALATGAAATLVAGGYLLTGGGAYVCAAGTIMSGGAGAIPACSAGGVASFIGWTTAGVASVVAVGTASATNLAHQRGIAIRDVAVRSGCDAAQFR